MRKRFLQVLFLVLTITVLSSCKTKELVAKAYPYNPNDFTYPEEKYLTDKNDVGIAFSGGGPRSASLTTGQLRALNKLGLLDKVKYISAVSGGAWASIMYTYTNDFNDTELLGKFKIPEEITLQGIKNSPDGKLLYSITNTDFLKSFRKSINKGDEVYANILNKIYLKDMNLHENKYVSYNLDEVSNIINREQNKGLLTKEDFYTVNPKTNRPFLIVNGTIIGRSWNTFCSSNTHVEMTPLYTGISYSNYNRKSKFGGGYTETFSIDNKFTKKIGDYFFFKKRNNRFRLSDMMAITANAIGIGANKSLLLSAIGLPEIRFFSINRYIIEKDSTKIKNYELTTGDGGNLENLGLIPLLKRGVKKIIVFVNSKKRIEKNKNDEIEIDGAIYSIFGAKKFNLIKNPTYLLSNYNNEFNNLVNSLYNLKEKRQPLIYTAKYKVNLNPLYSIFPKKGETDTVQITWVYNDDFESQYMEDDNLSKEIIEFIKNKGLNSLLTKFPHLPTFGNFLNYKAEWANMLAHFSSWVVHDNQQIFKDIIESK